MSQIQKVSVIHCGFFKLDGGAMFGVVPRRMWAKLNAPDDNNLTTWAMRCLLVETADRKILIDTGIGNKQDAKFRSHFEPFGTQTLLGSLTEKGVSAADITDVFLTHLHFDHCGGAIALNEIGEPVPTFPNATYWTNRTHYNWAMNPNPREQASFLKENFVLLDTWGKLQFIEENEQTTFLEGFTVRFTNGHTEAMMLPHLVINDKTLVFCADSMPAPHYINMPYVMAYDIRPLQTLKEKAELLQRAVTENHILFFEHDPQMECGTVRRDEKGKIVLDKGMTVAEALTL